MLETERDTDFGPETERNSIPSLRRQRAAGGPITLIVNGKVPLVRDDKSFVKLLDLVDRLETLDGIRAGLEDLNAGRTQPIEEAFEEIRREFNIPRDV